jgi:hypothetical protein
MSSYHSSFTYLNRNSKNDLGWIIASFDSDNGEMDSYLSQEQIYTDSHRGTKRLLYGTRYNSVSTVRITVIKCGGSDFSVEECRSAYRLLTGNPVASWLDLYIGDELQYSFLGTVQDVKPYKMDARTIALVIYFESVNPWAYSPIQTLECSFGQALSVNDGVVDASIDTVSLSVDANGVLYSDNNLFRVTNDGTAYIDNSVTLQIYNKTDDLYTYIYPNVVFSNNNSDYVTIKNTTLNEETIITNMNVNEIITLSSGQFIISDIRNKIFGDNFNFVWPRLAPGLNNIIIDGSGSGRIDFTYRYPIKIGDCAIDTNMYYDGSSCECSGTGSSSSCQCSVEEQELLEMLARVLN